MKKPTFEVKDSVFLSVVEECEEAQCRCPQFRSQDHKFELRLLKGELCKAKILHDFATCDVLFGKGYSESLDEDTLDILDNVKIYRIQVRIWNRRNEKDRISDFDSMYKY